ncbi:ABC transporter, partial [Spraguea lophii 42_110]
KTIYCGEADKCEDFFQRHEFRRRDNSPFSDYVLEVLVKENVESGQLHEMIKINSSKFDDDKSKESYIEKTSNDDIFDFGFNLQHLFLLLKRRFSIYNLNKSKIGGYLYNIIFAVLFCYLIRYMSSIGSITNYKSMSIVNVIARNEGFLLMLYTYMIMNCRVCISSIRPEYVIVKRELGVRTYSILSYCFSIYLYEFIQLLPFTLLFSISCYIVYIEFLSFFHIFISVLTLAAFIPAFVLLGSFSKNEKIINYILIIPIILIYVDIGAKTLSMYDNSPLLLRIKRCFLIVNGIWLPTLVMFVFKYITTWFLISRNIKDEHDRAFYNNVIMKERLTFLYNNQPPFSMPISLLFCFTVAMILLYVAANVVMAGILFRSGIRMKLSKKK